MLDNKSRELEEQQVPLEEQAHQLEDCISEMHTEFVDEFKQKRRIETTMEQNRQKLEKLQLEQINKRRAKLQLQKLFTDLYGDTQNSLHESGEICYFLWQS